MPYKESHFLAIQDYIAEGSKGELTAEERAYEDLLYATMGVIRTAGRDGAINWLTEDRGCSRHVARRIYEETVNLFYADSDVKDAAWRNLIFQKLLDAARVWEEKFMLEDEDGHKASPKAKDFEAYAKLLQSAAKVKRLDQPEQQQVPPIGQQLNIITLNAEMAGMPATDKRQIMQNPHFKELPKRHQKRLAMEAGLLPFNLDDILDSSIEIADEVK